MTVMLVVLIVAAAMLLFSAIVLAVFASQIPRVLRLLTVFAFIPVELFCILGFLASMEPGDSHVWWRMIDVIGFLLCIGFSARLVMARDRQPMSN